MNSGRQPKDKQDVEHILTYHITYGDGRASLVGSDHAGGQFR
jgi:hypothetical protein